MAADTFFTDKCSTRERVKGEIISAENLIDLAENAVTAGGTVEFLKIPAHAIVTKVDHLMKTPEGAALTLNVGDGTTANLFNASVDLNAAAGTHGGSDPATEATLFAAGGKYFSAGGTVVGTFTSAGSTAAFYVSADYKVLNIPRS